MRMLNYSLFGLVLMVAGFFSVGLFHDEFTYSSSIEIDAPIELVFEKFSDTNTMPKWVSGINKLELVSGKATQVGSTWKATSPESSEHSVIFTLTAFQQPELFAYHLKSEKQQMFSTTSFRSVNGKTRLTVNNKIRANSLLWKSMLYLARDAMRDRNIYDLSKLKLLCEQHDQPSKTQ